MKVPPLSLVGMERLPLPFPFNTDLLWRYNTLGPPGHHSGPPPSSPSAAAAAATLAVASRVSAAAAAAANIHSPSPLQTQLPFAYDIKQTIPMNLGKFKKTRKSCLCMVLWCMYCEKLVVWLVLDNKGRIKFRGMDWFGIPCSAGESLL